MPKTNPTMAQQQVNHTASTFQTDHAPKTVTVVLSEETGETVVITLGSALTALEEGRKGGRRCRAD